MPNDPYTFTSTAAPSVVDTAAPSTRPASVAKGFVETLGLPARDPDASRKMIVGHQDAFSSIWNQSSRLWRSYQDEAFRDEPENARKMFRDAGIRSLLIERILPSTALQFQVVPDSPKDATQKATAERYTKLIEATPRFHDLKTYLALSLFYGKYGAQIATDWDMVDGRRSVVVSNHEPWSGDKINYDWDGVPAVLVRSTVTIPGARFRWGDRAAGKFLMLDTRSLRDRWIIQQATPVDRDFQTEADLGGQIHGEGLRSLLYWPWYLREQLKGWALDAVQRIGASGMLYAYCESGNPADEAAILKALADLVLNNLAVFPRVGGVDTSGIQNIPPSAVAYEVIRSLIDYFDDQIRMLIVGQVLSSETASTGMGSNVAEFHRSTKEALIRADVNRQDETLTTDLLRVLQRANGDGNLPFKMRIKSSIDDQDGLESLQKAQLAQTVGLLLDEEDVYDKSGFKKPADDSHVLKAPGTQVAMPGMPGGNGNGNGKPATNGQAALNGVPARVAKMPALPAPKDGGQTQANYAKDRDDPGVMIALYPPDDVARSLALPNGEPADELHCTLAYLGRLSEVGAGRIGALRRAIEGACQDHSPLVGSIGGTGRFPASISSDGMGVLYAGVDVPGLVEVRQAICQAIESAGFTYKKNHGFTPHVTLDYVDPDAAVDGEVLESRPVVFDSVTLAIGDERVALGFLGDGSRANYAVEHAPHTMTIQGKEYRGGEFIPAEKATSAVRAFQDMGAPPAALAYHLHGQGVAVHEAHAAMKAEGVPDMHHEATLAEMGKLAAKPGSSTNPEPQASQSPKTDREPESRPFLPPHVAVVAPHDRKIAWKLTPKVEKFIGRNRITWQTGDGHNVVLKLVADDHSGEVWHLEADGKPGFHFDDRREAMREARDWVAQTVQEGTDRGKVIIPAHHDVHDVLLAGSSPVSGEEVPEGFDAKVAEVPLSEAEKGRLAKRTKRSGDPEGVRTNYAAEHAPHNMMIQGKEYRGGEFIPGDVMDRATPTEKAAVEAKLAEQPSGNDGPDADSPTDFDRPSRPGVEDVKGEGWAQVRAHASKILSRNDATIDDLIAYSGAPKGAKVAIDATSRWVRVSFSGEGYEAERIITRDIDSGQPIVENDSLLIDWDFRGQGLGLAIFSSQVEAAAKDGLSRIVCSAGRFGGQIGYYVWPLFGYDAEIPEEIRDDLPTKFQGAERLSQIMGDPAGRAFWKENGVTIDVGFDLADGSTSRRMLDAYKAERAAR